jgi:hypothetical protein
MRVETMIPWVFTPTVFKQRLTLENQESHRIHGSALATWVRPNKLTERIGWNRIRISDLGRQFFPP